MNTLPEGLTLILITYFLEISIATYWRSLTATLPDLNRP